MMTLRMKVKLHGLDTTLSYTTPPLDIIPANMEISLKKD